VLLVLLVGELDKWSVYAENKTKQKDKESGKVWE